MLLSIGKDLDLTGWSLNYNKRSGADTIRGLFSDTIMVLLYASGTEELKGKNYEDFIDIVFNTLDGASGTANLAIENTVGAHSDGTNANLSSTGKLTLIYTWKEITEEKHLKLENYPNPFNPATIIRYEIPSAEKTNITLKIFDVLGREIETLVNEEKEPGVYEILFSGKGYSSGIYIYSLSAGKYHESRKLVLIR